MPGAKSPFVIRMDEVQKIIDPSLKELGFKKSQRTYNRQTEPGLVQVINFQMGRFEPPSTGPSPVPPWLKSDMYGKFTVNLGVFVEEVVKTLGLKPENFISEPSCMIRRRLGFLIGPERKDVWWNLDAPAENITQEIKPLLLSIGFDFLNRFASRSAIISDYLKFNKINGSGSPRARLDVGIILATRGDMLGAENLFREHLTSPQNNAAHLAYVKKLADEDRKSVV